MLFLVLGCVGREEGEQGGKLSGSVRFESNVLVPFFFLGEGGDRGEERFCTTRGGTEFVLVCLSFSPPVLLASKGDVVEERKDGG